MGKRRKLPPFTAADTRRMLKADGWEFVGFGGRGHEDWEHPEKPGRKVNVSPKWDDDPYRKGSYPWIGVRDQAGWSDDKMIVLFWKTKKLKGS